MLEDRDWLAAPGADRSTLEELRRATPVELPDSYFALLSLSNGGEGPLPADPFNLCLDTAEQVIATIQSDNHGQADLHGFLIIGAVGAENIWPLMSGTRGRGPSSP